MDTQTYTGKYKTYIGYYNWLSLVLFTVSFVLFILSYMLVQSVTSAPPILIHFATTLFYYHIAHFILGIYAVIYYYSKLKGKIKDLKIRKTIVSIIFTPISFLIIYMAVFLFAVSSCAGN